MGFLQDLRLAARTLRREKGFSAAAIATLALGIGAASAVFAVVDAVWLRPLPLKGGERLVRLHDTFIGPDGSLARFNTRGKSYRLVAEEARSFESLLAFQIENTTVLGGDAPQRVRLLGVTRDLTTGLGIAPALGRDFSASEIRAGDGTVALVSWALYRSRLGASPAALGKPLLLDGRTATVVGVMPPGFRFPYQSDVWMPARFPDDADAAVFARLAPGVTLAAAKAELATLSARLRAQNPELAATYAYLAMPAREDVVDGKDKVSVALLALVAFFLLLSSANVAGLLLARAVRRRTESAVRAALGAGAFREMRRLAAEGLVLAGLAGALGLGLAAGAIRVLSALVPADLADLAGERTVRLDARLLAVSLAVALVTAVGAALVPALSLGKRDLAERLRTRGTDAKGGGRLLSAFVVAEIALALALLSGAAVLLGELQRLSRLDVGVDTAHVLTVTTDLPSARYPGAPERTVLVRKALEAVRQVPGISAAGTISVNPLWGPRWLRSVLPEGSAETRSGLVINHRLATPGALEALGVKLLEGRAILPTDTKDAPPVVLLSKGAARRLFGSADPLGKRVRPFRGPTPTEWKTVVGVVSDVRDYGLTKDAWYVPYEEEAGTDSGVTLHVMARTSVPPASLAGAVRSALWRVDPDLSFAEVESLEQGWGDSIAPERTGAVTVSVCAALGLALAALGLFATLSYAAARRKREIGVRLAIGAPRAAIARLVVSWAGRLVALGLLFGFAGSLAAARLLRALLAEAPPASPPLLSLAAALVAAVSLAACAAPALAATRVDPMLALKTE